MIEVLSYQFMQNALIAALLVSVATGVMGAFVVVNRMVFISGAVAHAAYGGVGIATFFGWNVSLGAFVFSGVAAVAMGAVQRAARERADTIIGALWAIGMAIGIVFVDFSPAYRADLMSYLFGSILTASAQNLLWMAALDLCLLLAVWAFYKELTAMSFDREHAAVRNAPVRLLELLLLALAAMAVVLVMQAVGLILVIALLTIPAAIAGRFVDRLSMMMLVASALGFVFNVIGLALAYAFNLSSGAAIILVAAVVYLATLLLPRRAIAANG